MDTIFAISTPPGRGGVAVVRVSGPLALAAAEAFGVTGLKARQASLRSLCGDGEVLDQALVLWFESGSSFTGEDVVELHLHGSPAIQRAVLDRLGRMPDLRMAHPGEFTRRALESGRMDLAEVEGLAALIDAETEMQRKQALRVFSGALGRMAEEWRTLLVEALALLEVTIDFSDEDIPESLEDEVEDRIGRVLEALRPQISGSRMSERIQDGFEVAIIGSPNSGKSTLLNALAGREAALTSEIAGTTRDVIEVRMDLAGLPVTFLDTAGLRQTEDKVEGMGIVRATTRARQADLRLLLLSSEEIPDLVEMFSEDIQIWGKGDLRHDVTPRVSGLTGEGLDNLVERIGAVLAARAAGSAVALNARHRQAMQAAEIGLEKALNEVKSGPERTEIAAEELRGAVRALESLVGRVDVELVLDEIFGRFCLGK